MFGYYEFFSGGGMVRAGLGNGWNCLFANDYDEKKAVAYKKNWSSDELHVNDIRKLTVKDLPIGANLAWASSPCQDLSLAGRGKGLNGQRSGTFWSFYDLMKNLCADKPEIIVLENVYGTLTSHGGKDFSAIGTAFSDLGYKFGALIIDAALFVPQSRPRFFLIAVRKDIKIPGALTRTTPFPLWHPKAMINGFKKFEETTVQDWVWWNVPVPKKRKINLVDIIEENIQEENWHSPEYTEDLLKTMTSTNMKKVNSAQLSNRKQVGTVYRRTRKGKVRAEIRIDGIAGCLRTPTGGSSRQILLVIEKDEIKSRLLSPRETARLMGLPDSYILPENKNEAYYLTGDGVVVPVVSHLAKSIFEPILHYNLHGKEVDPEIYVKGTQKTLI
jgi:DNA (cytosine-5)-methyltransferase 1